jgi:hypothetical protein
LNINEFQEFLPSIEVYDIIFTKHFKERTDEDGRNLEQFEDVNAVHKLITSETPKGVIDQENNKFQILYRINDKYDAILICAVRNESPLKLALITGFKQESSRRVK